MRKYANKSMEELARELTAGLGRLKRGYIDAAETLLEMLDPRRKYPVEFIIYRLTGYRPRGAEPGKELIEGESARGDLQKLILDLCDSFDLKTTDYDETIYDTRSLARTFNVSTKTIQRWRRSGLPARRLIFPDGKRRLAFIDSSVQRFAGLRRRQVKRSIKFSQLNPAERADIIRRGRRMVGFCPCTLSEVARRIADRTGRAVETIRYTIRKYDRDNPAEAVFPRTAATLDSREKTMIYRSFLRGMSAPVLAKSHHRTRGSIYRVVNEMRANQLLARPISYIYNDQFDATDADEEILGTIKTASSPVAGKKSVRIPAAIPPYLRSLYEVPLLSHDHERNLFRRYNYLKYKADKVRGGIDIRRIRTDRLKQVETLLLQANGVKNQIIRANLRLVVSIAKKHVSSAQTLFELISDGNVSLMRAVEKFDYARGFRFSTYASWAIIRNFARSVPKERYQMDRFATGHDEILDIAAGLRSYDPNELNISELRESIDVVLAQLAPMERTILMDHYGLIDEGHTKTLEQLGKRLGISKERVRQIEIKALKKLRTIMGPQKADLLA